jgi:hypothetical protein
MSKWIVLMPLALFFGGCSSNDDDGSGDGPTEVTATLGEWFIDLDPPTVPTGEVAFDVVNEGEDLHELVVLRTELAEDALPTNADGTVDEEGEGVEAVDEIEDIAGGGGGDLTVDLTAGHYVLVCNLSEEEEAENHYAEGMHATLTVE